ncbi:hypothetical protein [Bacillus anthracis]|uniref:hypothetical protein n=1 Tax=Bacillus anthracis TaxID=1392 RepID=UPI003BF4F31C
MKEGLKAYALRPSFIYCNICKNFFVRSSFGFVNTSSGVVVEQGTPEDVFTNPKEERTKKFLQMLQ